MKTSLRKKDTETERQKESHRYIIRKKHDIENREK